MKDLPEAGRTRGENSWPLGKKVYGKNIKN